MPDPPVPPEPSLEIYLFSNIPGDNGNYVAWSTTELPTVEDVGFSYSGHEFLEWNTLSNGTGTSYDPGDQIADSAFYAIWVASAPDVAVSYNGSSIASLNSTGEVSLATEGTFLVDDVTISYTRPSASLQSKTVSPSTSSQSVTADSGYDGLSSVTVNAMPSGTAGTPTATKGTVSNHSVSVTPSVTNISGYIVGGTKTGTAVSVAAAELVSGTKSITAAGTTDVTNYASASVAEGSAGTPIAGVGTVTNHSVSITPSVTNTTGYIAGGTITGTAVSVSASELVSGTKSITTNGNGVDVTNYAAVDVNVPTGITPTGTKNITISSAGTTTTDVTNYASAEVVVPAGSAATPATTVTATPTISVNSSGLITATASATKSVTPTISAGFVSSGTAGTITVTGSNTSQLTTQAAQTITPTTSAQTIASGRYLTGAQTIEGVVCTNLTAANIASGVTVKIGTATDDDSVMSVTGTYQGGGGGDTTGEDGIVMRTLSAYTNNRVTTVGRYAFAYCYSLTTVSLPLCKSVQSYAFAYCSSLSSVSLPRCETILSSAFMYCSALSDVSFPLCTDVGSSAFAGCSNIKTLSFPWCSIIRYGAFISNRFSAASFPSCRQLDQLAFARNSNLVSISLPQCSRVGSYAFGSCYSLPVISLPAGTSLYSGAFQNCYNLVSLYLMGSVVCRLGTSTVFNSTPIGGYSLSAGRYGSVFVPSSLYATYVSSVNWSLYSSRIVSM